MSNTHDLKAVLFDFDGVLSKGRFYSTISDSHPEIHSKIVENIFSKDAWEVVQTWMRGEKSFEDLHSHFSKSIGTDVEFLNRALIDSVLVMQLNKDLVDLAQELRSKGIKTAIFTDNMDIFERVFVPYNNLTDKFDFIFSSSTHKKLKLDNDAEFLKEVLEAVGDEPQATLFLDDSPKIGVPMREFRGHFYLYEDYDKQFPLFRKFLKVNFNV